MSTASTLFELLTAHWTSAILASGVDYGVFALVERGSNDVPAICEATGLTSRAAQTLIDGLVGVGALQTKDGHSYANTLVASRHLVPGKPDYLGSFARI